MLYIIILIAIVAIIIYTSNKKPQLTLVEDIKPKYKAKKLLTNNEIEFFGRLKDALPNNFIFTQVSLGAMLQPESTYGDKREFYKIRGTFAQKIADFVVCDKELKVIAVIELDDKTHNVEIDQKRDEMMNEAGYKVIRWQSNKKPSVADITKQFNAENI